MKLRDAFPSIKLRPSFADIEVQWDDDTFCPRVIEMFHEEQNEIQREPGQLEVFTCGAHADLIALKKALPAHKEVFDVLQFDLAITVMGYAVHTKQIPILWASTIRSLHDEAFENSVEWTPYGRIAGLFSAKREFLKFAFLDVFLEWSNCFYYAAWKIGDAAFRDVAINLFPATIDIGLKVLGSDNADKAIEAATALRSALNWDVVVGPSDLATRTVIPLHQAYVEEKFSREVQVLFAMMFVSQVAEFHGFNLSEESNRVLDRYSANLTAHEKLQVVASLCCTDIENAPDKRSDLIKEIAAYHEYLNRSVGSNILMRLYDKGPVFEVILPLLLRCLEAGNHSLTEELLAAWRNEGEVDVRIQNVLLCTPTRLKGIAYFGPHLSTLASYQLAEAKEKLRHLIRVTNRAVGSALNIPNDPEFALVAADRMGHPDYGVGRDYEETLRGFYLPDFSRTFLKNNCKLFGSLAVVPYFPNPLQALILRDLGVTLPLCVSWRVPEADRKIARALIYADGVMTAQHELKEVRRILESGGVFCEVIQAGSKAREQFLQHYTSDDYDLIWLMCHGEFSAYTPHESHIPTQASGLITLEDLAKVERHASGRRLLVLNICSGAAGAMLGGLMDLGLGPVVTSERQAVLSHLWPVALWTPVAFGALLAGNLLEFNAYFDAFVATMRIFSGERASVIEGLLRLECPFDLIDRVDGMGDEWSNILHWGSPVFLQ